MAWTTPRTWSPGETVTASLMNAQIRDNMNVLKQRAIVITIGSPGGGEISTGVKGYVQIPMDLTVTGWTIVADQSGDIVVDVWKDTYANFPPTVADTIAGSEKPTLSSAQKNQDTSLSTWDDEIDAGDILGFNVDSVSTVEQVIITFECEVR